MGLPERVRVKISSEAAGYIALTPVVVQEMEWVELLEHIAAQTSGDPARLVAVLRRGSVVSGASRLRWTPPEASDEDLARVVRLLPAPDPARKPDFARCVRIVISGSGQRQELDRDAAARRRLLNSRSCWGVLAEAMPHWPAEYAGYLYRERADQYRVTLDAARRATVREACSLLRFASKVDSPEVLDLLVRR
jgi:hypothetical protein